MNLTKIKQSMDLASISGANKTYVFNFQSLSGLEVTAFRPDIVRMANDPQVNEIEPLGQDTGIPKKWNRWEPNRLEGLWEDSVETEKAEEEPASEPNQGCADEQKEMHKHGYTLDNGMYKKNLEQDITTLATYGYYTVREAWCMGLNDLDTCVEVNSAYNFEGHYIGNKEDAEFLCKEKGIIPELADPSNKVCSVGWSQKDNLWYGWSHRAIYGFCETSEVNVDSCAYKPSTLDDALARLKSWHYDEGSNPKNEVDIQPVEETDTHFKFKVRKKIFPVASNQNPTAAVLNYENIETVPRGRGTWIAENDNDAKQMAIDFAQSVSTGFEPIEEKHLSSLSANKNPLDYGWYRYVAEKPKEYNNHHRSIDLVLEKGEKFGVRYSTRAKAVYIIEETNLGAEFKLTEREATLLLKRAKPFRGNIQGIRVTRGDGSFDQMAGKTNKIASHTGKDEREVKPKTLKTPARKQVSYFGFFKPNVDVEKWAFVENDSVEAVKKTLDRFMSNRNLAEPGVIVSAGGSVGKDISAKLGSKTMAYMNGHVFSSFKKRVKVVVAKYVPKGVVLYDESVEVPAHDESDFRPTEVIFYGNESNVLKELQSAVILDKKYTGIFSKDGERLSRNVRVRKTSKGIAYVLFKTSTVNKKYIQEAQYFVRRLENDFGKLIAGNVTVLKDESITVTVFLKLKKTPAAQQERSKLLDTIQKNSIRRVINTKISATLIEEQRKLSTLLSKNRLTGLDADNAKRKLRTIEKELVDISNSYVEDKVLAYNTPMYTVKQGTAFLPVEVSGLDIAKGTIKTKLVRGNRLDAAKEVTNLYSLDGENQLL